ncbi:hypothetical protein HA466_0028910 [Hirschfeldia incana]|nr:hypothetical protein HA466_0028910 [Hirschfeldia incana]
MWCRAFFRSGCCCADTHNNLIETFNRTLKIARKKPFVQMLELIRRDAMQRIVNRYKIACKKIGRHTKKARKEEEKSCEEAQHCHCLNYWKWHLTGIPCRHAVCAIRENTGLFWEEIGGERIFAPPYKRPTGRLKGKARIKGVHESPSKKKVCRKGRQRHCGLCGEKGHNSRKCPHESQEDKAKRSRLNEEAQLEAQAQGQLQGQEEADDKAQEEAEMEADSMAQLVEDQPQFKVQDISSTALQPTRVLRRSNHFASLLFG